MMIFSIDYSKNLTEKEYLHKQEYEDIKKKYYLDIKFLEKIKKVRESTSSSFDLEGDEIVIFKICQRLYEDGYENRLKYFPFEEGFSMIATTRHDNLEVDLRAPGGNNIHFYFSGIFSKFPNRTCYMSESDPFFEIVIKEFLTLIQYDYNCYIRNFINKYKDRIVEDYKCEDLSFFYKMLEKYE